MAPANCIDGPLPAGTADRPAADATLDRSSASASPDGMPSRRRTSLVAAATLGPLALAYRFAVIYRTRAGVPKRRPPKFTPADFGLPYEETVVPSPAGDLAAWFVPARGGEPGPGIVLVHGWESARDRAIPNIQFLHAAGYHCLVFDVRGHGANPPETLPVSAGEFGADAAAGLDALLRRPEVTKGAIFGHSMGAGGAILAAAWDPRTAALVSTAAPSDPFQLTRLTFQLAGLPIPDPIAWPLAWLTMRVYLRPRGHRADDVSARVAIGRYDGPVLLAHGSADRIVPLAHLTRLSTAAGNARRHRGTAPVEVLVIPGGSHSWLYEDERYRRTVARFLAESLGGPYTPENAAVRAAAADPHRLPEDEAPFAAVTDAPGRIRTLAELTGAIAPSKAFADPAAEPPLP
jgi:pimeloyl-ACP methyl ester carboxylesterase